MRILEVDERTALLLEQLVELWEASVRATHLFLSASEIAAIKEYVPQALREIPRLIVAENAGGFPVAFMGVDKQQLEMLFVSPLERGKGFGRELVEYGITHYAINGVAVNEQNPLALGFYQHMGFEVYQRTAHDEQGNPYPLLYMSRNGL